jgi:hypothetical protein
MKKNIYCAFVTLSVLGGLLSACKSNSGKGADDLIGQGGTSDKNDTATANTRTKKVHGVFYSVPSALEISQLLKESGAGYSESYPSNPDNVSKYSSKRGQSVNLGVYAADLSYAGIYEQKEESMLYLKCANSLATSLGIPNAFGESTISRIQANIGNKDSLLNIITEDYWNTDSYLKNNDRPEVSALIMAGGWIEGLYIATQIASKSKENKGLTNRVAEQKLSLMDLIDLVNTYPATDPGIQGVKAQLKKLADAYAGITIESSNVKVTTDSTKNSSTLGGDEKVLMTPEQLKNITDVTAAVRNEIILTY